MRKQVPLWIQSLLLESTATAKVKKPGCGDVHGNRKATGDRKEQISSSSYLPLSFYCSDLQSLIGSGLVKRKCGLQSLPRHCKAEYRRVGSELGDNGLIAGTNTKSLECKKCRADSPLPNLTDSVLCLVYVCRISVGITMKQTEEIKCLEVQLKIKQTRQA